MSQVCKNNYAKQGQGEQSPRFEYLPKAISRERAEDAIDLAAVAGLILDPWQERVIRGACGIRQDGKWAAFEVGLIANRQNGKGSILEAREIAGLFIWDEKIIIHSAHKFNTAVEAFNRIRYLVENTPVLEKEVKRIRTANGEEGIELKNGCRIKFVARSSGNARGFTGDTIILDEAYNLPSKMIASMMPTMAARSVEANPQIWYTSSAGMPDSEVIEQIRQRGLGQDDTGRLAYMEFSVKSWDEMTASERSCWPNREAWRKDPIVWAKANPALYQRISEEYVLSERAGMSASEFERERLGVWELVSSLDRLISNDSWDKCANPESKITNATALSFALDIPPGRDMANIAVAALLTDGRVHIEIIESRQGVSWVPNRASQITTKWNPCAFVVDAASQAGTLLNDLKKEKVRSMQISMRDYAQACSLFYDLVIQEKLLHIADPLLGDAVASGRMQARGDSLWTWTRKNTISNISPLVASTIAVWGIFKRTNFDPNKTTKTGKIPERRAIIL